MKTLFLAGMIALTPFLTIGTSDFRPPLDKSGYEKTAWTQVNPWFPLDKARIHAYGGPNYARKKYTGKNVWGQGMLTCEQYGLTGWQVETMEPQGYEATIKEMLKQAAAVGTSIKIQPFLNCFSKTPQESLAAIKKNWASLRNDLRNHPNLYRLHNRPVIVIVNPQQFKPAEWKILFDGMDAEFGSMIYLANMGHHAEPGKLAEELRAYMPYFDGVTNYGALTPDNHRDCAKILGEVMHREFPRKICEGGVFTAYLCHFHMGGCDIDLTQNYRNSFNLILGMKPDSISITNFFDHYENSLILPCYEREDFAMRYLQYQLAKWRGTPFPREKQPELVLTGQIMVIAAKQDLTYEVIGFPIDSKEKNVLLQLELCDASGRVIHRFDEREMTLNDDVQIVRFTAPAEKFATQRCVIARLRYRWNDNIRIMPYAMPTTISPSIRTWRMFFARSTKNALMVGNSDKPWSIGGKTPGQTLQFPVSGILNFRAPYFALGGEQPNVGYAQHSILRNGNAFYTSVEPRNTLNSNLLLQVPYPGDALNFYHLEMENDEGYRFQSLPIYVSANTRPGKVKIPLIDKNNQVREFEIEKATVPFYYYPCKEETGAVLADVSGYMHNGHIGGSGYGGGHLGFMGYYYYHNGPVDSTSNSLQCAEADGSQFIRFNGTSYVTVMGGTAFPGASTYELEIRPAKFGRTMGLLGAGNRQIILTLLPDGRVQAARENEIEAMGGMAPDGSPRRAEIISRNPLKIGKWSRIAAVYDCRKLSLYVDGKKQGEAAIGPCKGHEWINHILIGAHNKWVWDPIDLFEGDMREIRFYGRNLLPEEFLGNHKSDSAPAVPIAPVQTGPDDQGTILFEANAPASPALFDGARVTSAPNGFFWTEAGSVVSRQSWDLDENAEYELSFELKSDKPRVFCSGFATGEPSQAVYFLPHTETILLADVTKNDTQIRVKDASEWQTGNHFMAFNAQKWQKDLPNRSLSAPGIKAVRRDGDGWLVELAAPAGIAVKAGGMVREHCYQATFNFVSDVYLESAQPVKVQVMVPGKPSDAVENGRFWPGTKKFHMVFCPLGDFQKNNKISINHIVFRKRMLTK